MAIVLSGAATIAVSAATVSVTMVSTDTVVSVESDVDASTSEDMKPHPVKANRAKAAKSFVVFFIFLF